MCKCTSVISLNEEGKKIVKTLQIFFFIYLFLIIGHLIFQLWNFALLGLFLMLFLLITFLQCYYLSAGILIVTTIYQIFESLVFLGLRIQNTFAKINDDFIIKGTSVPVSILMVICIIFYFFLIYYSFQAYKEFKAISKGAGPGYCNYKYFYFFS